MNKLFVTFLAFGTLISLSSKAQFNPQKNYPTTNSEELKNFLTVIASDSMEGRETGTLGQRKAAAYIASQYEAFGLQAPAEAENFMQYFPVGYDTLLQSTLTINKMKFSEGRDYVNELPLNADKKIKADGYVFAGYGISDEKYDDYKNVDVRGKFVIIFSGEPKRGQDYLLTGTDSHSEWVYPEGIGKKAFTAMQKGALALMIIRPNMESINPQTARLYRKSALRMLEDKPKSINTVIISHKIATQLLGEHLFDSLLNRAHGSETLNLFHSSHEAKISYNFRSRLFENRSSNVVGYIEGTDKKNEYLILTGHYDHLGTRDGKIWHGADDDGSGTCAVLAMASAFAKAKAEGKGPRRTVIFMTVSGEEEGLWGSEYYGDHPLFPLNKTTADLNTDMVGRIDPKRTYGDSMNYIYIIGDDKLSSDLAPISDSINKKFANLELDRKYNDLKDPNKFYYRSDHFNFARKGVPVIFFFNGTHKDYHQPTDTIDKINWDLYGKRVEFIFQLAWAMANREDMIKRDIPLPSLED